MAWEELSPTTLTITQAGEPSFDAQKRWVACGGDGTEVKVWSLADWSLVYTFTATTRCFATTFSPDGSILSFSFRNTNTNIGHIDTATWTVLSNAQISSLGATSGVYAQFAYSSDGTYFGHYDLTTDELVFRTVAGDTTWTVAGRVPLNTDDYRGLGWHSNGHVLAVSRVGNYYLIEEGTWTVLDTGTITGLPDAYQIEPHPTEPWFVISNGTDTGPVTIVDTSGGVVSELQQFSVASGAPWAADLSEHFAYYSRQAAGDDIIREADGSTWDIATTLPVLATVLRSKFSPDGELLAIADRDADRVRVHDVPTRRAVSMHATAAGTGTAAGTRNRAFSPSPRATTELDIDAEGPLTGFHLLDDYSETGALDPYTGQKASFALDTTKPVHGTHVLQSGGNDVGITHTEWTLRYGSRYRFWMDPSGAFSGLYIGSTQGGLSTGEMEGVGVGSDPTFGSLDIVTISAGTWDYDQFVRAPISSGNWSQFEVIVEDPETAGSEIIFRLLTDKGTTVAAEVRRSTAGFSGVAEPVIGVAADDAGARFDKLETDDLTTFPGHWIEIHGSASGSLSATPTKERDVTHAPSASATASASVTKDRPFAITGNGTGDGAIRLQRASDRALVFGASAAGTGDAALTKTAARTFDSVGTATATVPLDKERATTYAGVGSAMGSLAVARPRSSSLSLGATGAFATSLDTQRALGIAPTGTGIAHGRLLRGESANIISTRTLIGRAVESTPRQIGEFTEATPRLSGTDVTSAPRSKGTVIEETPELKGRAVREHPPIIGTLIRD